MLKHKNTNDLILYRERMGFTQRHVAILLGLKGTALLSRLEAGDRLPHLTTALKLAAIYRVPVDFLYSGLYHKLRTATRLREEQLEATVKQPTLPLA